MSSEKIQDMLKALSADPKAQELLAEIERPDDQDTYCEISHTAD